MSDTQAIKIGMFGGGGVGKTCITLRYLKGEFTEGYIPTIEDEFTKVVEIDGKAISLGVIDTAGQDDFAEMRYSYYSKVQGFVFVMDISNQQSIDDLKTIYNDASDASEDKVIGVIAANKADLRDEGRTDLVSKEECSKLEKELGCKVFETSAKANLNIDELFLYLVRQLVKRNAPAASKTSDKSSKKPDESGNAGDNASGGGGCCLIA